MLIPKIRVRISSTSKEFDSAYERAIYLRDNGGDRFFSFYYVQRCEIEQTFNKVAQTCIIQIPRNVKFTLKPITKGLNENKSSGVDQVSSKEKEAGFQVGDVIEVFMTLEQSQGGLYSTYGEKRRYSGYIKAITPSDNLIIECEDDSWILKQKKLQKAYKKGTVLSYVQDMVDGLMKKEDVLGGNLSTQSEAVFTASGYRLKRNPTIFKALQGLDSNFKMKAFFKDRKLYIGKLWYEAIAEEVYQKGIDDNKPYHFQFQNNILNDKLKYQRKDTYLKGVEVEVISSKDNSRFTVFSGTEDGDVERIPAMDISKEDAQALADNHLKRISYDGFRGSFKAHIEPYLEHGWYVKLTDPRFDEERSGIYVVEKIILIFTPKGAFQEIFLNSKVTLN